MLKSLAALGAGTIFGLGLGVSHMADPAKVLAFLDVAGAWDPSLALVMGGAVAVAMVGFRIVLRRPYPVLEGRFDLAGARTLDLRLIGGSAVFGVGWGMVGFCPGPAISSLAYLLPQSLVFVVAMLAGAAAVRLLPPAPVRVLGAEA